MNFSCADMKIFIGLLYTASRKLFVFIPGISRVKIAVDKAFI